MTMASTERATTAVHAMRMAQCGGARLCLRCRTCIARVRAGEGFVYRHPNHRPVRDRATLQRIARLAIPPAYEDV
jgi:DNA topoisomerase-1